jgi:hypothetical protein
MPLAKRAIQAGGLTILYIRYWHLVFVVSGEWPKTGATTGTAQPGTGCR